MWKTPDFDESISEILDAKIKEKGLVNKSNNYNLVKNFDLNTNFATSATTAEIKREQDKIVKLQTHDLSYFLDKNVFDYDNFQNMLVYQETISMLELKEDKGTDYVIGWKSKWVYILKLNHYIQHSWIA